MARPPAGAPAPARPTARVAVLRDGIDGIEVLGKGDRAAATWHLPGRSGTPVGVVDTPDRPDAATHRLLDDVLAVAACRRHSVSDAAAWTYWLTPPQRPERYATWIFATTAGDDDAAITAEGRSSGLTWWSPHRVLEEFEAGSWPLGPPTWYTLERLRSSRLTADEMHQHLRGRDPACFSGHLAQLPDGTAVTMYAGDAGRQSGDPTADGPRHRLVWRNGGFSYVDTRPPGPDPS